MSAGEIGFLALAIGAITLFGSVLGWASWMEWRANRHTKKTIMHTPSGAAIIGATKLNPSRAH